MEQQIDIEQQINQAELKWKNLNIRGYRIEIQ